MKIKINYDNCNDLISKDNIILFHHSNNNNTIDQWETSGINWINVINILIQYL